MSQAPKTNGSQVIDQLYFQNFELKLVETNLTNENSRLWFFDLYKKSTLD